MCNDRCSGRRYAAWIINRKADSQARKGLCNWIDLLQTIIDHSNSADYCWMFTWTVALSSRCNPRDCHGWISPYTSFALTGYLSFWDTKIAKKTRDVLIYKFGFKVILLYRYLIPFISHYIDLITSAHTNRYASSTLFLQRFAIGPPETPAARLLLTIEPPSSWNANRWFWIQR